MNPLRHIRRTAAVLAGLACAWLGLAAAAPAAFARVPKSSQLGAAATNPASPEIRTVTRTVVVGGMPGWQIALIAVGAALLAAALAVLADRARAARRHATPAAA